MNLNALFWNSNHFFQRNFYLIEHNRLVLNFVHRNFEECNKFSFEIQWCITHVAFHVTLVVGIIWLTTPPKAFKTDSPIQTYLGAVCFLFLLTCIKLKLTAKSSMGRMLLVCLWFRQFCLLHWRKWIFLKFLSVPKQGKEQLLVGGCKKRQNERKLKS